MLLAELFGQISRCISFIDNDALLFILSEIYIDEEKRRIGIIKVFIIALSFIYLFLYFLLLLICVDLTKVIDHLG